MLADRGVSGYVIVSQPGATAAEIHAARELQRYLQKATGATLPIVPVSDVPAKAIVVGPRAEPATAYASDEIAIETAGERLLLAGGRPRGTLYAVYRFLQDHVGCRWWAPDAEYVPQRPHLEIGAIALREKPAFLWRDVYAAPAFNRDWAARNFVNGTRNGGTEETGGGLRYAGFVHTFYELVPPDRYFQSHPEWFSLVSGRRRIAGVYASQLCLSNADLRRFVAGRVKERLRADPHAHIASVSQNDWGGFCECDRCSLLYRKYGAISGALLEFVNEVAALVEPEFPHVVIDTIAYQQTRRPPKNITARRNVAVRVACIECEAGVPLDHPRNSNYAADLNGWKRAAPRLHVWEYTANYEEYFLPHPNWFVLGTNLRFFAAHGVESVFLQGIASPAGGELPELRAWVLARLAWNPSRDARQAIDEFLDGYYGPAAAKPIRAYLALMSAAAAGQPFGCMNRSDASQFLRFDTLVEAEKLWQEAEHAAVGAVALRRVQRGHLSVRYAWLVRWVPLVREARQRGAAWPLPQSRAATAAEWYRVLAPADARARLEEYPGYLNAREFARRLAVEPVSNRAAGQAHARTRWPVLPMPAGLVGVSALILAAAVGIRAARKTGRSDRALLIVALLMIAAAAATLWFRGGMLTLRYATFVLIASAVAVVASVVYFARSVRSLTPLRRAVALALPIVVAAYAIWWAMPYAAARLRRRHDVALRGAQLARANLSGQILQRADLRDANLRGAYMANAVLNYSTLDRADLRRCDLTGTMLMYVSMHDADLRGADLRGARIRDLTFTAFRGALYDDATRFPSGFRPDDWDMIAAPPR